ncbi:MAG: YkgJ family cysteine cluster protein [Deltaproteobacteria bacterium]|nr:MAG: YkgJ family cysteine cluster protein [Deltaproteobacteria bacterium]
MRFAIALSKSEKRKADEMLKSPENPVNDLPYQLRDKRRLGQDESFSFTCHPGVDCFTDCCANVNIILTPLDVLRLARRLGLTTGEFLSRHTLTPVTKDLKLPVAVLRMRDDEKKTCPFVGPEGCTVYDDRPWACRMYPVAMAIPPARAGVEPQPMYFLFQDDFCHGHGKGRSWTAVRWRENQGVVERDEIEEGFRQVVSHPWFIGGRRLDPKRIDMFYTACYDLDTFRRFVFESSFLDRFELEEGLVEKLRKDDEQLLRFAFRWLRFALFAEPTIKVKPRAHARRG